MLPMIASKANNAKAWNAKTPRACRGAKTKIVNANKIASNVRSRSLYSRLKSRMGPSFDRHDPDFAKTADRGPFI